MTTKKNKSKQEKIEVVQELEKVQDKTMQKRVFGLIGVNTEMGNWNGDFTGYPKSINLEKIYGSDKALKYAIRDNAYNNDLKVLYRKQLSITNKGKVVPMILEEKMKSEFEELNLDKKSSSIDVIKSLFKCWDVKQFGCAFPLEGHSTHVTGAVQITNGYNIYNNTNILEEDILSPFRNSNDKNESSQTTIGKRVFVDKAIYVYPFVINPNAYKEFVKLNFTEGYTEEDYDSFKKMATSCTNNLFSNTKTGCTNSFSIFIETKPNVVITKLNNYLEYTVVDGIEIFTLKIKHLLEKLGDNVLNIETYHADGVKVIIEGLE